MNRFLSWLLDLLYPPRCPLCQDILTERGTKICGECRGKAVPIREPKCKKCGRPLAVSEQELCQDCSVQKHFFTKGWAVFPYEKEIRQSVHRFKFQNKREYTGFYVSEMTGLYGKEIIGWKPDVIFPVPMYAGKKRRRGYNQAELLAVGIGRMLGIPVETGTLCRIRNTVPQKELSKGDREKNLRDAFRVRCCQKGRKILLVDDIYTTGATMDAASQVLLEQGAEEIRFLVLSTGRSDG